jgi:hypothetical protein
VLPLQSHALRRRTSPVDHYPLPLLTIVDIELRCTKSFQQAPLDQPSMEHHGCANSFIRMSCPINPCESTLEIHRRPGEHLNHSLRYPVTPERYNEKTALQERVNKRPKTALHRTQTSMLRTIQLTTSLRYPNIDPSFHIVHPIKTTQTSTQRSHRTQQRHPSPLVRPTH